MIILFWICFVLTVFCAIVTFANIFTRNTAQGRVASFVGCAYHVAILYLLSSAYL